MTFHEGKLPQTEWRKAMASTGNGACVEVLVDAGTTRVRDSVDPVGPVLSVSQLTWRKFTSRVRNEHPFKLL